MKEWADEFEALFIPNVNYIWYNIIGGKYGY
jgi:hypothetical protein